MWGECFSIGIDNHFQLSLYMIDNDCQLEIYIFFSFQLKYNDYTRVTFSKYRLLIRLSIIVVHGKMILVS